MLGGFVTSISTLRPDFLDTVKTVRNVDRAEGTLAGDRLEYVIETRNGGNDPSVETVLVDALPAGLTLAPGTGNIPRTPGREKLGGTAEQRASNNDASVISPSCCNSTPSRIIKAAKRNQA